MKSLFYLMITTFLTVIFLLPTPIFAQMATSRDWIGIFKFGDPDPTTGTQKSTYDWKYINCTKNPTDPVNWGECNLTMPDKVGNYEFRLYANDSHIRVGTSNPFAVTLEAGVGGTLCQVNRQATGLISTPQQIEGSFGNFVGTCITNPQAAYVPFKIPTYEELTTVFYNQVRSDSAKVKHPTLVGNQNQSSIPFDGSTDHVYHINGDLQLAGNNTGTHSGVVFLEGNLNIISNYTYGSGATGAVFVVKGNIFIEPNVTRIDAVLISEGIICTSTPASGDCTGVVSPGATKQLVINGNLIAINQTDPTPIRFRRNLTDNTQAAELVSHQSKYFVILKNIFSQTLTITTELN